MAGAAVTHKFVSTKPDGSDGTVVRPSNWNDAHAVVAGGSDTQIQFNNAGAIDGDINLFWDIGGLTLHAPSVSSVTSSADTFFCGTLEVAAVIATSTIAAGNFTIGLLPPGALGMTAQITDGDAGLAWGAIAVNSGAGTTKYHIWYNGTNWTVVGK